MPTIAPVRHAYVQRVAASRVAVGARNIAKTSEAADIETVAASKRTGAQEESLLHESVDPAETAPAADDGARARRRRRHNAAASTLIEGSLAWSERMKVANEAYRHTLERLDEDEGRMIRPGEVYDAPS